MSASQKHLIPPVPSFKVAQAKNRRSEYQKKSNSKSNWAELHQAYNETNEKHEAFKQWNEVQKGTLEEDDEHPREINDSHERALQYWRLAYDKIKEKIKEQKKFDLQNANVNQINGKNLEESENSESDFSDFDYEEEEKDQYVLKEPLKKNIQEAQRLSNLRGSRRQSKRVPCMNTSIKITGPQTKELNKI